MAAQATGRNFWALSRSNPTIAPPVFLSLRDKGTSTITKKSIPPTQITAERTCMNTAIWYIMTTYGLS